MYQSLNILHVQNEKLPFKLIINILFEDIVVI